MSKAVKDLASLASGVFGNTVASEDSVEIWLDTGFMPLNKAISGEYDKGLPVGRIIEMFGAESCGKTAIATSAMVSAQKMGGLAMFMDHERSFMPHLGEQAGLNIDPKAGNFVHAVPETFEKSLDMVIEYSQAVRDNKLIDDKAPILVVFDSLAAMVPKSKMAKTNEEMGMHDSLALAKACSTTFPVLQHWARKLNMCILILNQTRTDPGVMFGDNKKTPGGDAKNFYYSVRIGLNRSMIKKDKEVIGQTIKAKVIKNKVSKPFQECTWRFSFRDDGTGFLDTLHSSIEYLIDNEKLKTSGAYVEYAGKKVFKSQLADKIREAGKEQVIYDMIHKAA